MGRRLGDQRLDSSYSRVLAQIYDVPPRFRPIITKPATKAFDLAPFFSCQEFPAGAEGLGIASTNQEHDGSKVVRQTRFPAGIDGMGLVHDRLDVGRKQRSMGHSELRMSSILFR
jgi:hypothetical protein